jgi:hypothetical protein
LSLSATPVNTIYITFIAITYLHHSFLSTAILASSSNATFWDIFPAQAMEITAEPILREHGIRIIRVYNALASRSDLHAGLRPPDCTHFGIDALLYMSEQVVKTVADDVA